MRILFARCCRGLKRLVMETCLSLTIPLYRRLRTARAIALMGRICRLGQFSRFLRLVHHQGRSSRLGLRPGFLLARMVLTALFVGSLTSPRMAGITTDRAWLRLWHFQNPTQSRSLLARERRISAFCRHSGDLLPCFPCLTTTQPWCGRQRPRMLRI